MDNMKSIRYVAFLLLLCAAGTVVAQDSTRKKTIDVTSTFKPVLREAVKQNFSASLPVLDSIRPVLQYQVPAQQVKVPFLPGALNPVALSVDSVLPWQNSQYLKVGLGNVHLPYIQGAFSLGDERNNVGLYGEIYRAKGRLDYQKNNLADIQLRSKVSAGDNHDFTMKLGYKVQDYFFYGYQPDTLSFSKSQLKQTFQTVDGYFGFRNVNPTAFDLSYQPSVSVTAFSGKNDAFKGSESNIVAKLPLQKTFGKSFGFNLGVTADITRYNPPTKEVVKNNLYYVEPALVLKTPNVYFQGGITPSWDNKVFHLLPNVMAEFITSDQRFTFQAGWIGYFNRGSYQRFAGINPWIMQPDTLRNTRVTEFYAGFKGSLANHFTYSAKASYGKHFNENLFVNDYNDDGGKSFQTVYASEITMLRLHGEIGYMLGETFNFNAGVTYTNFSKVEGQLRAWGLLPMEINANLRWRIIPDLFLKADLYAWDGPSYLNKDGGAYKGDKAADMNLGVEFKVLPNLDLFFQMNNIFNNRYQRWNQYEVYGFQVLGGVILRMPKK